MDNSSIRKYISGEKIPEGDIRMRVTCDYDGKGFFTKWRFTCSWLFLKALSRGAQYGRRSAREKFHIKAHGLKISFRTCIVIRLLLGDDKMRIRFDIQKLKKPKQCLFTGKNNLRASRWTQSLREVLICQK